MNPRVTVILVVHNGVEYLPRTLSALAAQTHKPDSIIFVNAGSTDDSDAILADFGPTNYLGFTENLAFGDAVARAVRIVAPPRSDAEFLWLLAQDSAPHPDALAALLGAMEVAPSVGIVGPKQMDWNRAEVIRSFGQSITPFGASVEFVNGELDQAQYDTRSDVLAVKASGMLVRHTLWQKLVGFDRGLPDVDNALDFSIRARLAGSRVSVVPRARITTAADPGGSSNQVVRSPSRRVRMSRAAQLHRRLVYAPAFAVPLHWLTLVPLAVLRSIMQVLRKQPGAVGGELAAGFGVAFSGMRIVAARHALARGRQLGWAAIAPLRVPCEDVRHSRALQREIDRTDTQGERVDLRFFSGGGAWTVLGALVVGIAMFAPLLGAQALAGGALLPLSHRVGRLWENLGYGWHDLGLGFVGAADPFAAVVAMLGTLTFWSPSFSLVVLYFAALPLAALGAWILASRFTERSSVRAVVAVLWALAPPLLGALAAGRETAVLAHLALPWVFVCGLRAARSWSASAATGLLAAVTLACAPSLAPALAVVWIGLVVSKPRQIALVAAIPLPTVVMFAPLLWDQAVRGAWLSFFADPGAVALGAPVSGWQLVLGFPSGRLGGWTDSAAALGVPPVVMSFAVVVVLIPVAILALLSLFLPGSVRAAGCLLVALLGFGTAVAAEHIEVSIRGSQVTSVWPGAGLSLYWLGISIAAGMALSALGRRGVVPAVAAAVSLAIAVAPLSAAVALGHSPVKPSSVRTLPAYVTARAQDDERIGTLLITPQPEGGLAVALERGAGETLDVQSTLRDTDAVVGSDQRQLAVLGGNLASRSGFDVASQLAALKIGFVVLAPPAVRTVEDTAEREPTPEAIATKMRVASAVDGVPELTAVGNTAFGLLWRSEHSALPATNSAGVIPSGSGGVVNIIILIVQGLVIGLTLLLAIPTGAVQMRDQRAAAFGAGEGTPVKVSAPTKGRTRKARRGGENG